MNRENALLCLVFPMGVEARPFLRRVEVVSRQVCGRAVYREAFFEGSVFWVVRCGIGPARAAAAIRNMDKKPAAIISVGTAGSLVKDLKFGNIVIAKETVSGDSPDAIEEWSGELAERLAASCSAEGVCHRVGRMATVRSPVLSGEDRARLHELTGAHAVDMETHAMGLEAARLGVPFGALRVISDDMDSPPLAGKPNLRNLWRRGPQISGTLIALCRWQKFVRKFLKSVELLHPILVRVLRDARRGDRWIGGPGR